MSENKVEIMLKDVRCSYPFLFTRAKYKGEEKSYGSKLILDPANKEHAGYLKQINAGIDKLMKDILDKTKLPADKKCLRDGNDYEAEELQDMWRLSANSNTIPHVFLKGSNTETADNIEESGIYPGCFVNAKVHLWASADNNRVNCQLIGIQFKRDGESFSAARVSLDQAAKGFEVSDGDDFFEEAA